MRLQALRRKEFVGLAQRQQQSSLSSELQLYALAGTLRAARTSSPNSPQNDLSCSRRWSRSFPRRLYFGTPANTGNVSADRQTRAAARALGVAVQSQEVRGAKDLGIAFAAIAKDRRNALFLIEDQLTFQYTDSSLR